MASEPPNWRSYLVQNWPDPSPPSDELRPRTDEEVAWWEKCVAEGWTKGEAQGKQELVATNAAGAAGVQNASYTPDEYKFEMLGSDVVVMTHCGTTKGMKDGKEVTESHRSLHVFQKQGGRWQVVANAQLPIEQ